MNEHPSLPASLALGDGVESETSLLELIDHLLDKGCVLRGELVLGLADVDLIYVELSALLCSADRLLSGGAREAGRDP